MDIPNLKDFRALTERQQWIFASALMEQHGAGVVNYILDSAAIAMRDGDLETMKALQLLSDRIDELNGDHSTTQGSSIKPYLN